jgi:hypothetical protein
MSELLAYLALMNAVLGAACAAMCWLGTDRRQPKARLIGTVFLGMASLFAATGLIALSTACAIAGFTTRLVTERGKRRWLRTVSVDIDITQD